MSLRDDLAGVLARDPRYSIQAYAFVFEALDFTKKSLKKRRQARSRSSGKHSRRRSMSPGASSARGRVGWPWRTTV